MAIARLPANGPTFKEMAWAGQLHFDRMVFLDQNEREGRERLDGDYPYSVEFHHSHAVGEVREWCRDMLEHPHVAAPSLMVEYPRSLLWDTETPEVVVVQQYRVWLTSRRDVTLFKLRWHGPS